ncbi:hypothetical protein Cni_G18711 [Canna indica]|uniref:E3 ubiquitin-protein ligase PRT1 n=1 Tax=Canna indica TaxID=4628 RepID=A0AAQ3KJP9_9LILI|nr:hypothetical protein Cni_G18711 [Canna indica]
MADRETAKFSASSSSSAEEEAGGTLSNESSSLFQCCVCLDLLYKPIVLACGHSSCFWCVHKAMHQWRESHCAICRRPYKHFPSICQLLHLLLLKLEPADYKRREMEVLEEEKNAGVYSPQFVDSDVGKLHTVNDNGTSTANIKDRRPEDFEHLENIIKRKVSVDDVMCSLCERMLYQPAVLNCGHVYCQSCLSDLSGEPLQCHVCQSLHPGDFPNVCLNLGHFLEEVFPREYAMRREEVQLKKAQRPTANPSPNSVQAQKATEKIGLRDMYFCLSEDMSDVHVGVGCDSCGVYPIIGKRYKCKDCTEAIGFDLCEACYNTSSKLPGRFNQQHTPDHKFELDDSQLLRNILMRSALQLDISEQGHQLVSVPEDDDPHDYENHDDEGNGYEEK